jgi:hypothetical protein
MNKIRISTPIGLLYFAAGVTLLLSLGFVAWLNLPKTSIDFGGLTLRQESRPAPAALHSSGVNAEGLAIYHQSERSLASPRANSEGMAIYRRSEWGITPFERSNAAGLDIYWQSERSSAAPVSIEEGLAIYHQSERSLASPRANMEGMAIYLQSERNFTLADPDAAKDEGMEIYFASERGR